MSIRSVKAAVVVMIVVARVIVMIERILLEKDKNSKCPNTNWTAVHLL